MKKETLPESEESLWTLVTGPGIWFAHFLLSYVTAAVWCARFTDENQSLSGIRIAILLYTLAALAGITAMGLHGYRRHRCGIATPPHDDASPADRHRFLGFATLLLCALSFIATIYVASAVVFIRSCQ